MRLMEANAHNGDIVIVHSDLPPAAYDGSEFLTNARIMMAAIGQAPPKATKTLGNLERAFVRTMFFEMTWPEAYRELGSFVKAFDEEQVLGVHTVRVVLELAKLVRRRSGRYQLTSAGVALLDEQRTGDLYELLFRTYFATFNLAYISRLLPETYSLQDQFVALLWSIQAMGETPIRTIEFGEHWDEFPGGLPPHRFWDADELLDYAITAQIIIPLQEFGLLEPDPTSSERGGGMPWSRPWRLTSAFSALVRVDPGPAEPGAADAFVPAKTIDIRSALQDFEDASDSRLFDQDDGSAHILLNAWAEFMDKEGPSSLQGWDRELYRVRPGKKSRQFTAHFGPEFAFPLSDDFIAMLSSRALPNDPDVVIFTSLLVQEFSAWCLAEGLIARHVVLEQLERTEKLVASLATLEPTSPLVDGVSIVRIKVSLKGVKPQVWRRIEVWDDCTLGDMHNAINAAMGWQNSHLHRFEVGHRTIGIPNDFGFPGEEDEDEEDVYLYDLLDDGITQLDYLYDFGDGWEHRIVIGSVEEPLDDVFYPRCTAGANACPPEDVGGPTGYAQFVEATRPGANDPEGYRRWYGGPFDPSAFDIDEANRRIVQRLEEPEPIR